MVPAPVVKGRAGRRPKRTPADRSAGLLGRLGRVVRRERTRLGLTREALARRSGLSARFLAQLEAGTGNISLLRLQELARALDLSMLHLLWSPDGPEARRIALLGLRGAGKSTIGPLLARRLRVPFVELDGLIEEAAGLPLGQVFELHGERYFRRLEREMLARVVAQGSPAVLAIGGGAVTEPGTWTLLRRTCTTVWLAARAEDHYERVLAQGDRRPMGDNPHAMAELRALLAARQRLYATADLTIDTSTAGVSALVERLAARLGGTTVRRRPR